MTVTKEMFLAALQTLKEKQAKHQRLVKTHETLSLAKDTLIDLLLNDQRPAIKHLKNYHSFNINPFLVSHTLSVFSLNPYMAKRLYRKHKLYRGPKLILLYSCEIIKSDFVIKTEDGLVFGGEGVWKDFCEVIGYMEFRCLKDFFGLNEEIVLKRMNEVQF